MQPVGIKDGTAKNSADFVKGTKVILTANPADGSTFAGWSGGGCTGTGTCTVTLNATTKVTATFNLQNPGGGDVVNSVTIDQDNFDLGVGQTAPLTFTVDTSGNAAKSVTWESSDTDIATVDADGVVTAKAVGTATITAISTADTTKRDTVEVTVTTQQQVVVTIDQDDFTLNFTETQQLTATVTGDANENVTWTSNKPEVASVSPTGLVTAGSMVGVATITATSAADPTKSDTVQVSVSSGTTTPGETTLMVAASSDDAEEYVSAFTNGSASFSAGEVEITSSDLELTYEDAGTGTQQVVGVRFANLDIPQGATVTNAYIQFRAKSSEASAVTLSITAQNSVSAPTFAGSPNTAPNSDISSRMDPTTATVSWTPAAWAMRGSNSETDSPAEQTPDLSPVLQELVGNAAWTQNDNAVAFIITGSGTGLRRAYSYNGATAASINNPTAIPRLVVTYTTPNP